MPTKSDRHFARLMVQGGLLPEEQANLCLKLIESYETEGQQKALGDVILEEGFVQEKALRNAFSLMTRFPFERRQKGTKIGPYMILRETAFGSMGPCYEGVHTERSQESVMLKVLPPMMAKDPGLRELFFRQIIKAMTLRHENIARALEASIDGNDCYLVRELVPGQSLGTVLDHLPMLEEVQAKEIVVQVAQALRYAWKCGQAHGNLKPNNIILAPSGLVKVTDFCMAPFSGWGEVLSHASESWGTIYYCSPEHGIPLSPIDFRSDLYSLGVILYEMLTGGVPFSGGIPVLDLRRRMFERWPDPRKKNPAITEQALHLLTRMTAKQPGDRYQTMDDLIADIESPAESGVSLEDSKGDTRKGKVDMTKALAETKPFRSLGSPGAGTVMERPEEVEEAETQGVDVQQFFNAARSAEETTKAEPPDDSPAMQLPRAAALPAEEETPQGVIASNPETETTPSFGVQEQPAQEKDSAITPSVSAPHGAEADSGRPATQPVPGAKDVSWLSQMTPANALFPILIGVSSAIVTGILVIIILWLAGLIG